jgi:4-hydroxybenzoate polyprenyltransferase
VDENLLLFAGIVFAAELGDGGRWLEAWAAFLAYCAASSAAYIANDLLDAQEDRLHPLKRLRPIPRGELPRETALALAAFLATLALVIAAAIGFGSLSLLAFFLALQVAYSLRLKHVVLLDVMTIGALFVVRAVAGAVAVDVRISPWLLVCTALLALFLGPGEAARRAGARRGPRGAGATGPRWLLARARRPAPFGRGLLDRHGLLSVHVQGGDVGSHPCFHLTGATALLATTTNGRAAS